MSGSCTAVVSGVITLNLLPRWRREFGMVRSNSSVTCLDIVCLGELVDAFSHPMDSGVVHALGVIPYG